MIDHVIKQLLPLFRGYAIANFSTVHGRRKLRTGPFLVAGAIAVIGTFFSVPVAAQSSAEEQKAIFERWASTKEFVGTFSWSVSAAREVSGVKYTLSEGASGTATAIPEARNATTAGFVALHNVVPPDLGKIAITGHIKLVGMFGCPDGFKITDTADATPQQKLFRIEIVGPDAPTNPNRGIASLHFFSVVTSASGSRSTTLEGCDGTTGTTTSNYVFLSPRVEDIYVPLPKSGAVLAGSVTAAGTQRDLNGGPVLGTFSWNLRADPQEYDVDLRGFIAPESIDGPGVILKPAIDLLSRIDLRKSVFAAAASSVDGTTCGFPPGNVKALRFEGDNRGFSFIIPPKSYRIRQQATVSFDFAKYPSGVVSQSNDTGITRSYPEDAFDGFGRLPAAARADSKLNDCVLKHRVGQAKTDQFAVKTQRLSDRLLEISLTGHAADPAVRSAKYLGTVDWDVQLTIDDLSKQYTLRGSSTCYPAFELYVNGKLIFGKLPTSDSFANISLCLLAKAGKLDWTKGPFPLP